MRIGRTSGIGVEGGVTRRVADRRVEPIDDAARARAERPQSDAGSAGRALVPVSAPRADHDALRLSRWHSHAPFVTQLIATRDDQPHTRRLRRAEPAYAARVYGDAMDGVGLLVPGYFVDTAR